MRESTRDNPHRWTDTESKKLMDLIAKNPPSNGGARAMPGYWDRIAKRLGGSLTPTQVSNHYYQLRNLTTEAKAEKSVKASRVKKDVDDARIMRSAERASELGLEGKEAWAYMAGVMGGFWTAQACMERYTKLIAERLPAVKEETVLPARANGTPSGEEVWKVIQGMTMDIRAIRSTVERLASDVEEPTPRALLPEASSASATSPKALSAGAHARRRPSA